MACRISLLKDGSLGSTQASMLLASVKFVLPRYVRKCSKYTKSMSTDDASISKPFARAHSIRFVKLSWNTNHAQLTNHRQSHTDSGNGWRRSSARDDNTDEMRSATAWLAYIMHSATVSCSSMCSCFVISVGCH